MSNHESLYDQQAVRRTENVLSSRLSRRMLLRSAVSGAVLLALNEASMKTARAQGHSSGSRESALQAFVFGGAFIGGAIGASLNTRELGDGPAGRVILGLAGAVAGMFTGVALAVVTAK